MPPKRQKTDAPEDVGHADKAEAKAQAAAAKPAAPKAKSEGKTQAAAAKAAGAIVQWTGGEATIGDAEAETGDEAAIEKQPLRHQQPVTGDEAAIAAEAFAALQGGQGTLVRSTHGQMALPNPLDVVCTKCGETVDPCGRGVRLVAKTPPAFQCRVCNSRQSMLSQMFGRWPIDEFRALDAKEQKDFWASSVACHDKHSLKKLVEDKLVRRFIESTLVSHKGPYKPLSVWEKKGYDPVAIQQGGKYWKCPVVGDTYQLRVLSDGFEKREDLIREHMIRLTSKLPMATSGATSNADAAKDGEEGAEEGVDGQENASSSSSSSSSSDEKKKKKKKKKAKKAKKEQRRKDKEKEASKEKERAKLQAAADKAAEKAEKSRIAKIKNEASKAMAKLGPAIVQLEQTKKHDKVKLVPQVVVKKVNDALKNLTSMDGEARSKVASACPLALTFDLEEVP